jgi:hypothetical protein
MESCNLYSDGTKYEMLRNKDLKIVANVNKKIYKY